ncbi:Lecithin:cholesterol acyltransferase-domain-containing protein [Scenedesmus sp. NREL 46B-D3]|nr:Lecithin:cholesterol acyltransferase-domain-containing protein [Scenedesmus sp. NREL 46B-D3]
MGSDLDVRLLGARNGPCSVRMSHFSLWPPFNPEILTNPACFKYLLQPVPCIQAGRPALCGNPGVTTSVSQGGEDGMQAFAFKQGGYNRLAEFLVREYGYSLGKDLFAAPYDWRLSLQELDDSRQYDAIAQRVSHAVASCDKKAIILGHSMGTLVALGLLQSPRFKTWREQNVMGYIALAPPFGGSTYAIANKLGGNRINLLQSLGDLLQPVLNEIMYHGSRGMPSMLMMMPYAGIWGKEHAELYENAHDLSKTYCVYGTGIPTVESWSYRSIVANRPAAPGTAVPALVGHGDGVVNMESMQLCKQLTSPKQVYEIPAGVNHGNVVWHPSSLAAMRQVLDDVLDLRR